MREPRKPVTLGEVAAVALSGVDKHISSGEAVVRLCNYLDVYRNRRLTKDMHFSRGTATPAEIARFTLRKGDVLITKDSETPDDIGIPSVVADDLAGVICGYHLALLRPEGDIASNFLLHFLQSDSTKRHFLRTANGLTRFGLGMRAISSLPLPLPFPPSHEQATIADILDAVDTALERTRAAVDRAREVKRALVQQLFSNGLRGEQQKKTAIGLIPNSWDVVPVTAVVRTFQYGLSVPMEATGWMPILRMGNIQNGEVILDDFKYVNLPEKVLKPYIVRRGDVLFNRTNSQERVGKVGIYRDKVETVFASYLIRLIPDTMRIDNYYLGHVLGSYSAQCRIKRYATPGVQQVNINATNLGKVLIPVPHGKYALAEQHEIASVLEAADAVVRSSEPVLAAQQALKKSLMYDLLTGRVRVKTPAETVAS
jgi:type I restriction enzyme, S subunit